MIVTIPIPHVDPMPDPGPVWLFRVLLLLTFFLHVLFMNVLLGGSFIALVSMLKRETSDFSAQLSRDLGKTLPPVFAFTITLGVAPLLFLQVLYGQMLYASSILIGVPWIGVIALVLVAYYSVYYFSFKAEKNPGSATGALAFAVVLLAAIAHIYTNNFTLMLHPERWLEIYRNHPHGLSLNWSDPTVLPRYLHFVLAALAVAGLYVLVLGLRRRNTEYGRWLMEQGAQWFTGPTMLNYLVGFWFLAELPSNVKMVFMGGNTAATVLLGLGLVLPLAAIMHLITAKAKKPVQNSIIGIGSGVATVAVMVVIRDILRNAYLAPYFSLGQLKVAPQWGVIEIFVVLFVAGLGVLFWMLRAVAKGNAPDVSAAKAK
jgi:hypothetical protein